MGKFVRMMFWAAVVAVPPAAAKTPEQIFQEVSRSIVTIQAFDAAGNVISLGSGVVTTVDSVMTNCHVVEGGQRLAVTSGNTVLKGEVRAADVERDLCELAVSGLQAPRVSLYTAKLRVGQRVYAIGAPEGLDLTISEGLVSSIREIEGAYYIQTSAPISSGSSGGGLFDVEGRLVGLTAFILAEGQNLNFALPAAWITDLAARSGSKPTLANREAVNDKWQSRSAELRAKKDWVAFLATTQQWVRAVPAGVTGWIALGDAYLLVNRPRRAITAYNQALKLDGGSLEAWVGAGNTYLALNQYDRAVETAHEALRLRADNLAALQLLGTAYHHQNQRSRVREVYARMEKVDAGAAKEFAKKFISN